jgi:hypothetical protein
LPEGVLNSFEFFVRKCAYLFRDTRKGVSHRASEDFEFRGIMLSQGELWLLTRFYYVGSTTSVAANRALIGGSGTISSFNDGDLILHNSRSTRPGPQCDGRVKLRAPRGHAPADV